MIIFKDAVSGDELFSDTYKYKLVDDCVYEVEAKHVTRSEQIDDRMIGGNASAEGCDQDEGVDASSTSGINVVLDNRLVQGGFSGKKDYQVYIKDYMKKICERLQKEQPEEEGCFKKNMPCFIKKVLANYKEYDFYMGESMSGDGMQVLCKWDGETPYLYFFKHGLVEEKV